jgi:multidrug efflux pump subunit AcrA (membrane-fusion protein)
MRIGRTAIKKFSPQLLIVLFAVGGFSLLVATKPRVAPLESSERTWTVDTLAAAPGPHIPALTLFGRIESSQAVQLRAAVTADVSEVLVKEGDHVKKGRLLLRLDEREPQLQLRQREAELAEILAQLTSEQSRYENDKTILAHEQELLALAQQEFERTQRLKLDNLASQTRIDEVKQTVLRQQITVEQRQLALQDHEARKAKLEAQSAKTGALRDQAALDLERTQLRAPFDARITRLASAPGDRVRPGDALLDLYNIQAMEVRAQVPTPELPAIEAALATGSLGATATINGHLVKLALTQLSGDIKQGRGGRDALFTFAQSQPGFVVGQVLTLNLELPAIDASIAVPREAVYGGDRLYTVVEKRLHGHTIERLGEAVGAETAGEKRNLILVRGATLAPGDLIVVTQLPNAMDGLKVLAADR